MSQEERQHEELLKTASLIMGDDTHEIRTDTGKSFLVLNPTLAVDMAEQLDGQNTYISMNAVKTAPAHDDDVLRHKWLAVDIDKRTGSNPRNEAEGIRMYLSLKGFPEPVVGFSGRGVWLLYKCDMPNDDEHRSLRQRFLQHLHGLDGGEAVDVSVFNASRVMRFFGTMNPKGSRSRLWSVPDDIQIVPTATVMGLAPPAQESSKTYLRDNTSMADVQPLSGQATSYGASAADHRLSELREADIGTRNNTLTATARRLRELVEGQQLDYDWALSALWEVCEEIGLTDGQELSHTRTTIRANFEQFKAEAFVPLGNESGRAEQGSEHMASDLADGTPEFRAGEMAEWDDWEDSVPDIEWLVPGRIPRGGLIWAYGSKEVGKSLYFLGVAKYLTDRGEKVAFYSEEMPRSLDVRRITRLGIQKGNFLWKNGKGLNLADKAQLRQVIAETRDVSLIILDSYERVWQTSTTSENRRAVEFARACAKIRDESDATVVVIDHTGFGYRDEHGTLHDERKPRGASTKEQQADMSMLIRSSGKWDGGDVFHFVVENMKPGRYENPFVDNCEIRNTTGGGLVVVNTTMEES